MTDQTSPGHTQADADKAHPGAPRRSVPTRRVVVIGAGVAVLAFAAVIVFVIVSGGGRSVGATGVTPAGDAGVTERERRIFLTDYEAALDYDPESFDDPEDELWAYVHRDQQWAAESEFFPIADGPPAIAQALAPSLIDPSGVVDHRLERELLDAIAQRLWAYSQDTPDAYVELVENDPNLEWNEPDPADPDRVEQRRRNLHVGVFYAYVLGRPFDPASSSRATLLPEVWAGLRDHDFLVEACGIGERGARIIIDRALAPAQLEGYGLDGKHAPDDPDYWRSNGGRYGMQMCRPARTAESWLSESPSLTVAHANILVRLRDGRLGNWRSTWYLSPRDRRWALDHMGVTSGKAVLMVW